MTIVRKLTPGVLDTPEVQKLRGSVLPYMTDRFDVRHFSSSGLLGFEMPGGVFLNSPLAGRFFEACNNAPETDASLDFMALWGHTILDVQVAGALDFRAYRSTPVVWIDTWTAYASLDPEFRAAWAAFHAQADEMELTDDGTRLRAWYD